MANLMRPRVDEHYNKRGNMKRLSMAQRAALRTARKAATRMDAAARRQLRAWNYMSQFSRDQKTGAFQYSPHTK
jgi:hypothetical protein